MPLPPAVTSLKSPGHGVNARKNKRQVLKFVLIAYKAYERG